MKIDNIWKELEEDNSIHSGLVYKRLSSQIKPDIYVAIKSPEKLRCIAAHIQSSVKWNTDDINKYQGIKIESVPDDKYHTKQFLLITLIENQYKDIFSTLCEDLINQVTDIIDEAALVEELIRRLDKWQLLFEKMKQQGLSEEAQRGLYGELFVLVKLLNNKIDPVMCIDLWKGPEKGIQDFQGSSWAIEVKTTHGKNHQKIYITSERQLDTEIIQNIYLYHLSLDIRDQSGETLNEAVDNAQKLLSENYIAHNAFKMKLLKVGFFDLHRNYYLNTGYQIRQQRIFSIGEGFPRITESQIPGGVGDVKYSIILADSVPWKISEEELLRRILN